MGWCVLLGLRIDVRGRRQVSLVYQQGTSFFHIMPVERRVEKDDIEWFVPVCQPAACLRMDDFRTLGFQYRFGSFQLCTSCIFCSTMIAQRAPRDRASNPSAPVPANRSRQRAPGMTVASQLNKVSLIRSGVGRRPGWCATGNLRPRHCPPIILIFPAARIAHLFVCLAALGAGWGVWASVLFGSGPGRPDQDGNESLRVQAALECVPDFFNSHRVYFVDKRIQVIQGQIIKTNHGNIA